MPLPRPLLTQPRRHMTALATLILLHGCSSLAPQTPNTGAFAPNTQLTQWQLRGKIGIRTVDDASSAYLNWQQCDDYFDIRLSGPLGQSAAHLYGNQDRVTLDNGKNPPTIASTPELLLAEQLGRDLPVSQLLHWVKGIPAPGQRFRTRENGFEQSGWRLSYPRQSQLGDYEIPTKVLAQNPELKITLILKSWQLQPDCTAPTPGSP